MHEWNWESLRRPPSLHFSPLNLSIQTMKDIIVILITTSTVNCFLSVPWVQPLPQISSQPEDNKFPGCLFISFIMFFYAIWTIFLESQLKKALIATVTSRMKPRDCIYRITKQGKVLPAQPSHLSSTHPPRTQIEFNILCEFFKKNHVTYFEHFTWKTFMWILILGDPICRLNNILLYL